MNTTKPLAVLGVGAAVVAGSLFAVTTVSAHPSSSKNRQAEHVSSLAERFNLDEAEVQQYFNEKHEERHANQEEKRAEHVAELVESGVLTQSQADRLTEMHNQAHAEIERLKESRAERSEIKAFRDEHKAEIKAWADAEGLNLDDIRQENGNRHRMGRL